MLTVVQPIQRDCTTRAQIHILGWSCTPEHQQTGRTWSKELHLLNHSSPWHRARPGLFLWGQRRSKAVLAAPLSQVLHCSVKGLGWCEHVQPAHPACSAGLRWICWGYACKDFVNLSYFQTFTAQGLWKWPQFLPEMLVSPQGCQDVFTLHTSCPHLLTQERPQVRKKLPEWTKIMMLHHTKQYNLSSLSRKSRMDMYQAKRGAGNTILFKTWDPSPESCTVLIALLSWTHKCSTALEWASLSL